MSNTITLPALPECPHETYDWSEDEKDVLRARDLEVARVVLEAAEKVCDSAAIDATSEKRLKFLTVQGKAIYEGMYRGAINCAADIRNLEVKHHE